VVPNRASLVGAITSAIVGIGSVRRPFRESNRRNEWRSDTKRRRTEPDIDLVAELSWPTEQSTVSVSALSLALRRRVRRHEQRGASSPLPPAFGEICSWRPTRRLRAVIARRCDEGCSDSQSSRDMWQTDWLTDGRTHWRTCCSSCWWGWEVGRKECWV